MAGDVLDYAVRLLPGVLPEAVAIEGRETFVVIDAGDGGQLTVLPLQSDVRLVAAAGLDLDRYAADEAMQARAAPYYSSPFFDRGTAGLPIHEGVPSDLPMWGRLGARMRRDGQVTSYLSPHLPRHAAVLGVLGELAQTQLVGLQPWVQFPDTAVVVGDAWEQPVSDPFAVRWTLTAHETVLGYRCAQLQGRLLPEAFGGGALLSFDLDGGVVVRDQVDVAVAFEGGSFEQSLVAELVGRHTLSRAQVADLRQAMAAAPQSWDTSRPSLPRENELVGRPAPDFRLADLSGGRTALADHRGQVVVVSYGVAWDPTCAQQVDPLVALHREHGDRGLAVLGVFFEPEVTRPPGRVEALAASHQVPYRLLLGNAATYDAYALRRAIPTTLLIDRVGVVRRVHFGYWARPDLEPEVLALLAETP